jgi:hypothetical protein
MMVVHGQGIGTGVEAGDVQPAGAHGLDLGRVGLDREELHFLAGDLLHVGQEIGPGLAVDGRIFDRCVSEDDGIGIDQVCRIGRRVGGQIAVTVAILLVEGAARAVLGGDCLVRSAGGERKQCGGRHGNE